MSNKNKLINKALSTTLDYLKLFFKILVLLTTLLVLTYAIPNKWVEKNVNTSLEIIAKETNLQPFFARKSCMLDNFTDKNYMINESLVKAYENNPIKSAMDINGRARYWHGYQIFLRPLLTIMSYRSIRYLNMFVLFILLSYVFALIREKIGIGYALTFMFSIINICIFLVPMSITFMSVFVIMFISICKILKSRDKTYNNDFSKLFFVTGILVSYFDLLTVPLLTLGVPLIIVLILDLQHKETIAPKEQFIKIFKYSFLWLIGYALFWTSKWVIGSAILQKNVVADAMCTIFFRISGSENYPLLSRTEVIADNFNLLSISGDNLANLIITIVILTTILFIFYKKPINKLKNVLPLLFVGIYPYVWLYVLASHSQIHDRFTYRNQMIAIFAVLSSIIYLIQWDRVKTMIDAIRNIFRRKSNN